MSTVVAPLHDLVIVGGGAAGLATAIFAARARPGLGIVVVDGARTIGAKILVSGGGRCNVTNRLVEASDFNGGDRRHIARVLAALPVAATVTFFDELGVALHEEPRGKLFPDSNRARTVLDALLDTIRALDVSVVTGCRVSALERGGDAFLLQTTTGPLRARRVALATGGLSLPRTGSDGHGYQLARALGHTVVDTTPALVPLLLDGDVWSGLAGVSLGVMSAVVAAGTPRRTFEGPMLWTHVGVSGPVILDASRHWLRHRLEGRTPELAVSLVGEDFPTVESWLLGATRTRPRTTVARLVEERLPTSVALRIAALTGAEQATLAQLDRDTRRRVVHALTDLRLPVRDSRGYNHAEATAGGVALGEADPATMASRVCPGLFLVGEILDVDGRLGGFNFQWAWASACVAGRAIARSFS